MPEDRSYQQAGWEEIAGGDEPVRCEQCSYEFQPFDERCRRCGWKPGDPVDESIRAGPGYDELKAEQEASDRSWQRCMWVAAIVVCAAAPIGYLIGQFTTDGAVGGAIIAAFLGGIVAGVIARPDDPVLGGVIGTVCAVVYLVGAVLVMMTISHDRYNVRPTPSWGTLMIAGVIGGTIASIGTAWQISRREQMF
ncbi:MAG: hypothetical protein R6V07_14585 [Armatimonadota bacterium]